MKEPATSRRTALRRPLGAAFALAMFAVVGSACPSLDDIALGECGNGVVERDIGEDCDAPPEAPVKNRGDGSHCARANEPNACHFVWDAATCCPAGTGAGVDGRCRTPSGVFEDDPLARIAEPALGTGAADVDGDGYEDLAIRYRSREIELRFLGPEANRAPRRDVRPSSEVANATFGSLAAPVGPAPDECGRPTVHTPGSVFVPTEEGLRVLLGRAGGDLLPKAFTTFDARIETLPLALPARSCFGDLGDLEDLLPREFVCTGALAEFPEGVTLITVSPGDDGTLEPKPRYVFPVDSLAAVGSPRPQRVAIPDRDGCDGLLVRFDGADDTSEVSVLGLCGPGWDDGAIELEHFVVARDALLAVLDVDHDGADDLVVATAAEMEVRRGDGGGAFELAYTIPTPTYGDAGVPLAIGFLDQDDAFDVVHARGVLVTNGRCPDAETECAFDLAGGLAESSMVDAVVADVNGDGLGDVVARGEDAQLRPLLVVGTSGPDRIYSFDERPTFARPSYLSTSDFDGNGVRDVAFVLPTDPGCASPDSVQILYGERGTPGEARTVAELSGIRGMAAGPILNQLKRYDGLGDLGITSTCPEGGAEVHRASVVFGTAERSVDSPYALPAAGDEQERVVFGSGRFSSGDDHPDLVALGYDGDAIDQPLVPLLMWVIPATRDSELPPNDAPEAQAQATGLAGVLNRAHFALLVDDVDCPTEADEASAGACSTDEILVFQSSGAAEGFAPIDEPRLHVFRGAGSPAASTASCGFTGNAAFDGDPNVSGFTSMITADVDGDGLDDVVAWWFAFTPDAIVAGDAYVFWNDEAGFGGTCPVRLPAPPGQFVTSVDPIRFGEDGGQSLVIGAGLGAYRLTVGLARDVDGCASGDASCALLFELPGASNVGVIDYDLDGLDDLVIALPDEIQVRRQRASDEVALERSQDSADD